VAKKLTLTQAFANFGATPVNVQWACSAIANDGESIVMSGWNHMLSPEPNDRLVYEDSLSDWKNRRGANLLQKHLAKAMAENLPIQLILATTTDEELVEAGEARNADKTFANQYDLVGSLIDFDADTGHYVIEFAHVA
jgi:hypothetical protein